MFERLKNWFKGGMQKMAANTGMAREFKDIFQLGGVPAFNQFYYFGIFVWKYLYRGYYSARCAGEGAEAPAGAKGAAAWKQSGNQCGLVRC